MAEWTVTLARRVPARTAARRRPDLEWAFSLPLFAFLAVPLVVLLLNVTPEHFWANLAKPEVYRAIFLSLGTSAVATGVTVLLGTPAAYLMARRQFPGKSILDTLIDLPTVLPPAVAGVALLLTFGRRGPLGSLLDTWGIHIAFTQIAVVMAQTFIAAPLFLRAATIGLAGIEPELEQATAMDGATRHQVFWHITVPLAWRALVSGAVMTWARALGEFGATIIFAGNLPGRTQTMPLAIYLGFEIDLGAALALSVILICCSFLVLIAIKRLVWRE